MSVAASPLCSVPGVCSLLPGLGSSIAKGAADSVFSALATWLAGGATWLVGHVLSLSLTGPATTVNLHAGWFEAREQSMVTVAVLAALPLVLAATLGAVLRQDGRRLMRIYAVGVPVGLISGVAAVTVAQLALTVVNALCTLITPRHQDESLARLGERLASPAVPAFVQFVIASVVILGAMALWLELVLRASVIYLAVFFLPLGLAAFIWPATAHISKRFVELLIALIGSKFVIVAALTIGAGIVDQQKAGVDDAITGAAVLLLTAFAPFAVLRLVPLVEVAAAAHLEGMARRPARAATDAAYRGAGIAAGPAGGLLDRMSRGQGSGVDPVPIQAAHVADKAGDYVLAASSGRGPDGPGEAAAPSGQGGPAPGGPRTPPGGSAPGGGPSPGGQAEPAGGLSSVGGFPTATLAAGVSTAPADDRITVPAGPELPSGAAGDEAPRGHE